MSFKAIIFDVDGTLSETEEAHRHAFNDTFREFGLNWSWSPELYRELLKTTGGKERMAAYVRDHLGGTADADDITRIHKRKTERYGELIAGGAAGLRPGIKSLIEDATRQGCRLAVATTTNRPNVDKLIAATLGKAASDVFEVIAAGDEVENKKPAPDVFNLALAGLGLAPEDCVAMEDSRNGLLSARGAGIPCVVSPSIYTNDAEFSEANVVIGCFSQVASIGDLRATLTNSGG
jgi:HAD superfamily hydrolase (TIGR01509 family)